ncbi:MAG: hypothetical protein ACSHYF_11635 [Verrucomicrobiaceae bacterium]
MKILRLLPFWLAAAGTLWSQEAEAEGASVTSEIGGNGQRIVVEAHGVQPEAPLFYSVTVEGNGRYSPEVFREWATLDFVILQGEAKQLSVEILGSARVVKVEGESVKAWSVREEGEKRFLDLTPKVTKEVEGFSATVHLTRKVKEFPVVAQATTFGPDPKNSGFVASYSLKSVGGLGHRLVSANGAVSLDDGDEGGDELASSRRTEVKLEIFRKASRPLPVELVGARLEGRLDDEGGSAVFSLRGTVRVTSQEPVELDILRGEAAPVSQVAGENVRLVLEHAGGNPVYRLKFTAAGEYPLELSFVAPIESRGDAKGFSFQVPGGAVVPVSLSGVAESSEFLEESLVQPDWRAGSWLGFLPASGQCHLAWKPKRTTGDGKLFFTSEAMTDLAVGAGLIRQVTELQVKTLQGALPSLTLGLAGKGEILAVEGENVLSWKVNEGSLEIILSRPVTAEAGFVIRAQSALTVLPAQLEPLRLTPEGAVRHSGYVRVFNQGAIRFEVMKSVGLTQLSPDQFPEVGQFRNAPKQVFYYRYPAAERNYVIAAERVKPEVNVSQLLNYELTETDRVVRADLELDVREAGIREFEFYAPADYAPVAITGVGVSDYVSSAPEKGMRRIKVIFESEVGGEGDEGARRLIKVHLEHNAAAKAGAWTLPTLSFPGSKFIRGEFGVSAAPGYRVSPGTMDGVGEMPLIHFQNPGERLQLAYRIRTADWKGTLAVEALSQNVQADVFHLYALKENTAYVSVLVNYFVTGSPVSEWTLAVPEGAEHLNVDGRDVRDSRVNEGVLTVPLHRPVMGAYQLLVTYEQKAGKAIAMGGLVPQNVQGERGFVQVVSPGQVELSEVSGSENLIKLDPLELPAEYRLMSHAPSLAAWQYTGRPIELAANISWFERGEMARQIVEYADLKSRIARDGGAVTESVYEVRTRGERTLTLNVPRGTSIRSVSVDGVVVTIREAGEQRLVPLPETVSPNRPVRIEIRSSSMGAGERVQLSAPTLAGATQLVTKWTVEADAGHVVEPINSGKTELLTPFSTENGFQWIERNSLGIFTLVLLAWAAGWGMVRGNRGIASMLGADLVLAAAIGAFYLAWGGFGTTPTVPTVLEYSVPVLAPDESLALVVDHREEGRVVFSDFGMLISFLGLVALYFAWKWPVHRTVLILGGAIAIGVGTLAHAGGAGWFFLVLGGAILWTLWHLVMMRLDDWKDFFSRRKDEDEDDLEDEDGPEPEPNSPGGVVAALMVALTLGFATDARAESKFVIPEVPTGPTADLLTERWVIADRRIEGSGSITVTGKEGERFVLLRGPGVLTKFEGGGLKVITEGGRYLVVPTADGTHEASFSYQAPAGDVTKGLPLLSGLAAVHSLEVRYEAAGWDIQSPIAVQRVVGQAGDGSAAKLWLRPIAGGQVVLSPKARDVAAEATRFFSEVSQVFIPGPGVVDGIHQISIRPSQGQVKELVLTVPKDFTVSDVRSSVVGPWRFDPEKGLLRIEVTPGQSKPFALIVETQRSLATLPAAVDLQPMRVQESSGEVGMIALGFGKEAQLDKDVPKGLSLVNLADFDGRMIPMDREGRKRATLQKVYRYSEAEASLNVSVAPVAPEVRVISEEKISLGDERVVLGVDFTATITRAGVFRLSFPLPAGFEVESLTGGALHHWVEVTEEKKRVIVMNLRGKTIGAQKFSLVLSGPPTFAVGTSWLVPKFRLSEATRQSGQMVIVPGRGIQVRVDSRKDVSALDPRSVGGNQAGSLAFRLLQDSWSLGLAIDQLEPSIAARMLHDVELREGRSKSRIDLRVQVDQASIRSLRVRVPGLTELDEQTLRASGSEVRDIVQVADEPGVWDVQFKRRVAGETLIRIEYEQNEQDDAKVQINPCQVMEARQQETYLSLRPGVRLELSLGVTDGWLDVDWSAVPKELRQVDRSGAPAACLRTMRTDQGVMVSLKRHAVVSGDKLRVKSGALLSVLSPNGELMNQADLVIEARQRGPLNLTLPRGSRLFGVFVNEESALVVRKDESYVFHVSGDAGTNEAKVRVSYATSLGGASLDKVELEAFRVGEPLENVTWKIVVPEGYRLRDAEGDLDVAEHGDAESVSREEYLALVNSQNSRKADGARDRLGRVATYLQQGEQGKAAATLEQVWNGNALDAASNEDARVKLENLVTQQAMVGLNTRRQRLYLDNKAQVTQSDLNDQIEVAANANPVFSGNLNYDVDDFANVTRGNDAQVNRMLSTIAAKWVKHQRVTEPVSQLLDPVISAPGKAIVFEREIQVSGQKPLRLELDFEKEGGESNPLTTVWLLVLLGLSFFLIWRGVMRSGEKGE